MSQREQNTRRGRKWFSMLRFLIASYLITGALLLLLAFLLYRFRIPAAIVSAGIILTYIASNFVTGLLAGKTMQHKKYLWGLCLGGIYFAVLLLISLCLKKDMSQMAKNLPLTMLLCMGSGMLGGMLG